MLSIEKAIDQLLDHAVPVTDTTLVTLHSALHRVLAENIISTIDVPPADNSAMDGYAINIDDIDNSGAETSLPISQTIAAGNPPSALAPGTAARIFTGAEAPPGANAVIMQEHCTQREGRVYFSGPIVFNNNIRRQGQDIRQGHIILHKGQRLQPQHIGLLASVGIDHISVYRKLRVAILSTGDELEEPGKRLGAGKIYNSNRYMLRSFLTAMEIEVIDGHAIEDTPEAALHALKRAARTDCIISTGGVSVGDADHIKAAVNQLGTINFWRIAMKPGKPIAFGQVKVHKKTTPFIGLPGNPAAVFISFLLLARPFLYLLKHQPYTAPASRMLPANFSHTTNTRRQEYLRAKINKEGRVDIYPNQSSGVLSSTVWAQGLVVVPPLTEINKGDMIEYFSFAELF